MILQDLAEYGTRIGASADIAKPVNVSFELLVSAAGKVFAVSPATSTGPKGKTIPFRSGRMPRNSRTNGVAALIALDQVAYLAPSVDRKSAEKLAATRELVTTFAADEPGLAPLVALFGDADELSKLGAAFDSFDAGPKALVEVFVEYPSGGSYVPVIDLPRFAELWIPRMGGAQDLRSGICLVCGKHSSLLTPKFPGTSAKVGAAPVTVNDQTQGGWGEEDEMLAHTPICLPCGQSVSSALDHLANNADHSLRIGDAKTTTDLFVWWSRSSNALNLDDDDDDDDDDEIEEGGDDDFSFFSAESLLGLAAGTVARDVASAWRSALTGSAEMIVSSSSNLHLLHIKPYSGRLRFAGYERPDTSSAGAKVIDNLLSWSRIASGATDGHSFGSSFGDLADAVLPHLPATDNEHRFVPRPNQAMITSNRRVLIPQFIRSALYGEPISPSVLRTLMDRLITDVTAQHSYSALTVHRRRLIALIVDRSKGLPVSNVSTETLTAYGETLDLLRNLQRKATGTRRPVVDSILKPLLARPASTYSTLRIDAHPWIVKRTTSTTDRELLGQLSEACGVLPDALTAQEQGIVLLAMDAANSRRITEWKARQTDASAAVGGGSAGATVGD